MNPVVYRIDFPDGSFYVGCTVNFSIRRSTHLRCARNKKKTSARLQQKLEQFPVCCIYVVACGFSRETLHELEQQIIDDLKPTLNTNPKTTRLPPKYSGAAKPWDKWKCLGDAAREIGFAYHKIKRIARRYTTYEAYLNRPQKFEQPKQPKRATDPHRNMILFRGKLDYAKNHRESIGMGIGSYRRRLKRGLSALQALESGPYVRPTCVKKDSRIMSNPTVFNILGVSKTVTAWAASTGIPSRKIHNRICIGWTPEEALEFVPRPRARAKEARARIKCGADNRKNQLLFEYQGFVTTLADHCRRLELNYHTTYQRMKSGLPVEQVFSSKRLRAPRIYM